MFVLDLLGRAAPGRMTDGNDPWAQPFERSYHPEDPLDRAIMDTRRAVFPHWGLWPTRSGPSEQPRRQSGETGRVFRKPLSPHFLRTCSGVAMRYPIPAEGR